MVCFLRYKYVCWSMLLFGLTQLRNKGKLKIYFDLRDSLKMFRLAFLQQESNSFICLTEGDVSLWRSNHFLN